MKKVILKIGGMSCSGCSSGLEKYLNKQEKIYQASVNLVLQQAVIEYDDSLTIKDLEKYVEEAGFDSLGVFQEKLEEKKDSGKKTLFMFLPLTILILYISMSHMLYLPTIPFLDMKKYPISYSVSLFLLTIPFLIYAKDIFKNGIKNFIHKTPNMDTLVSIGVATSFIYSCFHLVMILLGNTMYVENLYFESCSTIIFFIKLGRLIDHQNKEKTTEALKELVQITPTKALLKDGKQEKEITIDEVKKNDILICKPGMKVAVDGVIIAGESHFDEAFITGESLPVKKKKEDKVIAGSMNLDGYIEYRAEKIGKDSTISEIVHLVVEATSTKAPIQRLADVVSSYFVPTIIMIAIITLICYLLFGNSMNEALTSFVTVLVVACPCSLGLATPLAIIVSEGECVKKKILVKKSETLENSKKVDTIVFDKTGTLTYGNLKIAKIYNDSKYQDEEFIRLIASMEHQSTHPIGKAFLRYVEEKKLALEDVDSFQNISGMGIKANINQKEFYVGNEKLLKKLNIKNTKQKETEELTKQGNSIVYCVSDKKIIGVIGVKDIVRENAKVTVEKLIKMKKNVIMLTGDHENTANIIASSIGIQKVISNVLPQEKTKILKELIDQGHYVMMVGDGINDAPSLATCHIGVSMNSATDIAIDSADIILMQDDLEKIPEFLDISKKTLRIIKENLFWAFFYNICMIPIAIGFLKPLHISMNPMFASLAMTMSSLTVVLNSLRLKRKR